jgi:simple sugar transport system permease protein
VGALGVFLLIQATFTVISPNIFLRPEVYTAEFSSLPPLMILSVALVFVITAGEIDLSFPSVIGLGAYVFSLIVTGGGNPFLGLAAAAATGAAVGVVNGGLVAYLGLSSLVATLGMNFALAGFLQIETQGYGLTLTQLPGTTFYNVTVGSIGAFPVQMIWGLCFVALGIVLFRRHRFGARVAYVGDNAESAREMGMNVRWVKTCAFMFMGFAAGIAGVFAVLVDNSFYSTTGQGFLLLALAAVFVGGTPTTGGVGTVAGAAVGAFTVSFIEPDVLTAGGSGFYTQFFYGLIIIASLIGHKVRHR